MEVVGSHTAEQYRDHLETNPEEFQLLFNTILINVTRFFRDPEAWDALRDNAIPHILESKGDDHPIRMWVAGCSTGEEAYSLATIVAERIGRAEFQERVKIYASDADEEALVQARQGAYTVKSIADVPQDLREKYFALQAGRYSFDPELRRSIIFGALDLVHDSPISRVDLVVCRNTMMYFNSELQSRILARFHFALNDPGFLFLGKAEMLLTLRGIFKPVAPKHRIFRKIPGINLQEQLYSLPQTSPAAAAERFKRQFRLHDTAHESEPYAQIIIDRSGRVAMANEAARRMFDLSQGDINREFKDLEISYKPVELRSVIRAVKTDRKREVINEVERYLANGRVQYLDVTVSPLFTAEDGLIGVVVTFLDVTDKVQLREELQSSNQELETAYEELQSSNEELETTNEELQSTVEELETTNEELQSSNEELQTMNEELQSGNEELHTINDELRDRTDALARADDFLQTLLRSLPHGIIIVDRSHRVLAWNHVSEELWGLRADETVGEPVFDLDFGLPLSTFRDEIARVLEGRLKEHARTIPAVNRRGQELRARVVITPFRVGDGNPLGAMVVVQDGTELGL